MYERNTIRNPSSETHGRLLVRARAGDEQAWNDLVDRMAPLVWSVARGFRLDAATCSDVVQIVWLRLLENCDKLRDPECLPGWLAVTCRREAMAAIRLRLRVVPSELIADVEDHTPSPEAILESDEETDAVRRAFDNLSPSDQRILRLSVLRPELSYADMARILRCPIGSIGPTRRRALRRLEKEMTVAMEPGSSSQMLRPHAPS